MPGLRTFANDQALNSQPAFESRQVKDGRGGFGNSLLPGVNIIAKGNIFEE